MSELLPMKDILKQNAWVTHLLSDSRRRFLVEAMVRKKLPGYVRREIERDADAYGVNRLAALVMNLTYEAAIIGLGSDLGELQFLKGNGAPVVGCTTLGYWCRSSVKGLPCNTAVIFGRNLDWPDPDGALKRNITKREYSPRRGFFDFRPEVRPWTSWSFPGFHGVLTGFAPGRFAVAINAVANDEPPDLGGEAPTMLLRRVCDEAESYEEAVRILTRTRLLVPALFTVVNAANVTSGPAAVVIERTTNGHALVPPMTLGACDKVVIATNSFKTMTGQKHVDHPLAETSCGRYDALKLRLFNARLGLEPGEALGSYAIGKALRGAQFGCTVYTVIGDTCKDILRW